MALARSRSSRPPPRTPGHPGRDDADDAMPPDDGESFAELVEAAAGSRELSLRDVAEALGLTRAALDARLATPSTLTRGETDALARVLGADRALFRRAVDAASARDRVPTEDDPAEERAPSPDPAGVTEGVPATAAPAQPPAPLVTPPPTPPRAATPAGPAVTAAEAPPLEDLDVVARALAAIADDAAPGDAPSTGARLRAAVLAAATRAARDAGRAVPAAWRDVAAALAAARAGTPPGLGDAPEPDADGEEPAAGARDAVLDAAARAVAALQRLAPGYDDVFAPVDDDATAALLRRLTVRVHAAPLGATGAAALVAPVGGRYLLVVSADATADQRRLAERRAAAHVVAGHVRADAPLPVPAPVDGPFERVADVAALADLIPFWQLHDLRRARGGRRAALAHLTALVGAIAGDWGAERVADRAALRLDLYRGRGV